MKKEDISLLRPKAVAATFDVCKVTPYLWVKKGLLTSPIKIGANTSAWPKHEINAIIAARLAGHGDDVIRALVIRLMADRQVVSEV